jgi:hypothetical protein
MKIKVRRTNGKYKGRKMDLNCKNSTVLLDGTLRPQTRPRLCWSKQGPGPVIRTKLVLSLAYYGTLHESHFHSHVKHVKAYFNKKKQLQCLN